MAYQIAQLKDELTGVFKIPLTQGQFAIVDIEDFDRINKYKWHAHWHPITKSFVAQRSGSIKNGEKKRLIYMHRDVMGEPVGMCVDHKDHDTLNNSKSNLRVCTKAENSRNTRVRNDNQCGVKGVYWSPRAKKFISEISKQGKRFHIGSFEKLEHAAEAYNKMAVRLFGEFSYLNKV